MGLISDIRDEVKRLDCSRKALRKFGILVGSVLLILAAALWFRSPDHRIAALAGLVGIALAGAGALFPGVLPGVYRSWMWIAFVMGWIMSRCILIILFYLVVVPTGVLARLFHKRFMAVDFRVRKTTYWVPKPDARQDNYDKMY